MNDNFGLACGLPREDTRSIPLALGEGGRLFRRFTQDVLLPALGNRWLAELGDGARLPACAGPLAVSTDSYVVSPLFFPGGDIGKLAVCGTVNDLLVSGAHPRWLSLSLIMEEGLPEETVIRVLRSIAETAATAGVAIVAGDTKVVPRGAADGLFLCTTGVGEFLDLPPPGPRALRPGDEIVVSGPLARHGLAVMAAREGLQLEPAPVSDCALLTPVVDSLRTAGVRPRALRDATRGGVAAVLHEWAAASNCTLAIDERALPITDDVRGASELLGIDPLHVACEGTLVAALPPGEGDRALAAWQEVPLASQARRIGQVRARQAAPVIVRRAAGRETVLDDPLGAPLPRIC